MNTSLKKYSIVLKQEGTSRQERYVPALHETSSLLDGRKLHNIILYMQQYAKNILFIDTDKNEIDYEESWEEFFGNDPVLLIAGIASLNPKNIKDEYDHLNDIFQNSQTIGNLAELINFVFARFFQINNWYTLSPPDSLLYQDLHLYIPSYLQKEMEVVKEMLLYCIDHLDNETNSQRIGDIKNKNEKSIHELQSMNALWKLDQKEKLTVREKIFSGDDENEKLTRAAAHLNKIFETVYYATETICDKSSKYFDETIYRKHNHNPHVALIITFIQLFQYEQAELNKIPQRLLKYYYRDFLRIRAKEAVPDKAYIVFELAKGFDNCMLNKGTRLSAGKDKQNKELVYETDKDIVVNKAVVSSLRTAFIDRKENGEILNYYTNTVTPTPGQVEASPTGETKPAKMFGSEDAAVTEIGFAIASSQFYLAKGERNVVITLNTPGDIESGDKTQDSNQIIGFNTGIIRLALTGEKGWISSEDEGSGITINSLEKIDNSIIVLNFSISIAQEQAIVAFNKKLHGENFNTTFPLLKCILQFPSDTQSIADADERIHQLNILQKLQVDVAGMNVTVGNVENRISFDGVRDLILENDQSALDSKKPFYPFTAVPKVSSSFYIGCSDLFHKEIQNLSINIEWLLPDNFNSYYQNYNPPYDSNKFMASLSYLEENQWKKYADVSLIETNTNDPRFTIIKINKVTGTLDLPEDEIPIFDNIKKNGTLKLKLLYPDFGHSIYPQLITSTVMDKATADSGKIDFYKLLKKKLRNETFSIELPPNIKDEDNGPLKVMYDILKGVADDPQARIMLINILSDVIGEHNNIEIITKAPDQAQSPGTPKGQHMIVHDERFIQRVLSVFRRISTVNHEERYEQHVKEEEEAVNEVDEDIYGTADFILPSRNEMNTLIINEIIKAIHKTVANAVDRILAERAQNGVIDPNAISKILEEEFDKAKKAINDMIVKKIAIFLSTNEIPPPPYSPLINTISLNYSSSKKMSRKDGDKVFQLTATRGVVETSIWKDDSVEDPSALYNTNFIVPQPLTSITAGSPDIYMQGMLFIGIKDMLPNGNLSLLFQIAEGSKVNDNMPPALYWYYLRHNDWVKLKKDNIISDSTYDLQTTGIIEFSIPADADNLNTFFNTTSEYWLCAGVASDADGFPYLIDVKAQSVGVTFVDYRNNPQHLALPLEAQKIKTVIGEVPQIKKIRQPESSFNGKLGENENEYYVRVSERLRHKSRAINNWDYESLVLDQFPAFFKVKCLNNYYNGHFAVGHVTIVPIVDLRNKNYAGTNIFMPKANYIDLRKVEEFLRSKSSPFVKIHAINPKIEKVLINCKVKFNKGEDNGFCLKRLNEDLVNFLTPWATDPGKISFSGKIYASSIITFIDKRPYVDYVLDLMMSQYTENDKGVKEFVFTEAHLSSLVETQLTTDHSILVSAPSHEIDLIE